MNIALFLSANEYNGKVFPNPEVAYGYRWVPRKKLLREIKNSPEKYTPWAITALSKFSSWAKEIFSHSD